MTLRPIEENELRVWARANLPRLRHRPSAEVADALGDLVMKVDSQLGVEVGNEDVALREVILTAFSDPSRFELVHQLRDLLGEVEGWRFMALKPPRGFGFALTVGGRRLKAGDLEFAPIPEIANGIALIIPGDVLALSALSAAEAEELAWLTVETGVGEEKAAKIQHIEFSPASKFSVRYPIEDLGLFLEHAGAQSS